MPSIIVVEDNPRLGELLREWLTLNGHTVTVIPRGDVALGRIIKEVPGVVILDIGLPGLDGLTVCLRAREEGYRGIILMLTARGEEADEVLGFQLGADDYVTKPVTPGRLVARIAALCRRSSDSVQTIVANGPLRIDPTRRTAELDGEPLELSTAEFNLLLYLTRRCGQVIDREEMYQELKGHPFDGQDRSLDQTVSRLRRQLGDDPRSPRWIKTVTGYGYLMVKES